MSYKLAYEAHDARAFTIPPHTCELSFGQNLPAPHRSPPDLLAVFLRLLASEVQKFIPLSWTDCASLAGVQHSGLLR